MSLRYVIAFWLCGAAFGASVMHLYAKHVTEAELDKARRDGRQAGYQAGYEDGQTNLALFRKNCSSFGSGDITFIVCKGDAK